jgi:hypothetical protein
MYTAIIIEPRKHAALEFVLRNFVENLPQEWNIIVFHGTTNLKYVQDILSKMHPSYTYRITLRNLHKANLTIREYNKILTSAEFYESIPTEIMLIFQTDSMLFPEYMYILDKFLKYDYVGAPWPFWEVKKFIRPVGNGGLSIRRKYKMLEIIRTVTYNGQPEDIFFCIQDKVSMFTPSIEEAKQFSVEHMFHEYSVGGHQPWHAYQHYPDSKHYKEVFAFKALQYIVD